ncbi:MAG: hypothetical protein AAGF01_00655 [Cyanobacteria bacterium P01_G01_bin.38]
MDLRSHGYGMMWGLCQIDGIAMSPVSPKLPSLTVNRSFIEAFITADAPCCALGMVEVEHRQTGFLALRPETAIPPEVSDIGFRFGHSLYGTSTFEVIHFGFEFYGFQTYHVLLNPNNPIVQAVLQTMLESGDYLFFALDAHSGSATAFRSDLGQHLMSNLAADWERIQMSTTADSQYRQAVSRFAENPQAPGILVDWVCRDVKMQ